MPTGASSPNVPPFTHESAIAKVRGAEDAWNTRDPQRTCLGYTIDSRWRNRAEFVKGREEIIAFLTRKWSRELDYRLIKELWAFGGNRIAVRFAYESHDDSGQWYRSYGNENWEYDEHGLNRLRYAWNRSAFITGQSDAGLMIIPVSATLACRSKTEAGPLGRSCFRNTLRLKWPMDLTASGMPIAPH
jgi:nuclear transport factor 2 (NTF2) superfamily protein